MAKKHRGQFKKTSDQQQQYKAFIANPSSALEGTIQSTNEMLKGSNEYKDYDNGPIQSNDPIKKTPIRYQIWDWLKKNIIPTIIGTIVVAIGTAVITHAIKIAVINQRIEYLEIQIQTIYSDNVTKEYLSAQLENIKLELSNGFALSEKDFEWRIKNIEQWIESMDKPSQ